MNVFGGSECIPIVEMGGEQDVDSLEQLFGSVVRRGRVTEGEVEDGEYDLGACISRLGRGRAGLEKDLPDDRAQPGDDAVRLAAVSLGLIAEDNLVDVGPTVGRMVTVALHRRTQGGQETGTQALHAPLSCGTVSDRLRKPAVVDHEEQLGLGSDVLEQGARPDVGAFGDLLGRHRVGVAGLEELIAGREDAFELLRLVALAAPERCGGVMRHESRVHSFLSTLEYGLERAHIMRAIVVEAKGEAAQVVDVDEETFLDGAVEIDVLFSSFNYKDGLAIAASGVARSWPLVPGIDVVGRVTASADAEWSPGDVVVLNGDGLGEFRHGGFATRAHVRAEALIRVPSGISPSQAAAIGTAGFTAMIGVLKLADSGVTPDSGTVLVTGAAGGVGSVAISLLAGRGYRVAASTGRIAEQGDYLRSLGASDLIDRNELGAAGKPLQAQRWAGAIDSVGSATLANILAQTSYGGTVVACGLAQGADLPTTVMPFILRDVTLTGANSVDAPRELRQRAWDALADELDLDQLDAMTTTIALADTIALAPQILRGQVRGRTVVDVNR
ncbi:MAG TPA: MDR family oxidoreductase [Microlunatus sp.]